MQVFRTSFFASALCSMAIVSDCIACEPEVHEQYDAIVSEYHNRMVSLVKRGATQEELRALGQWRRDRFRDLLQSQEELKSQKEWDAQDSLALAKAAEFLRDWKLSTFHARRAVDREETVFEGYLVLLRGSLNLGQIDSAVKVSEAANTACGQDAPLFVLHHMIFRTCAARERPEAFEHLNLMFDDGIDRLTSSRDAVILMMRELPAYTNAYEKLDAKAAGVENLTAYRNDTFRAIDFLKNPEQSTVVELRQILLLYQYACELSRHSRPENLTRDTAKWASFVVDQAEDDGLTSAIINAFQGSVNYMDAHSDLWIDPSEMTHAGARLSELAAQSESDIQAMVESTTQVLNQIAEQIDDNHRAISKKLEWVDQVSWSKPMESASSASGFRVFLIADRLPHPGTMALLDFATSVDKRAELYFVLLVTSGSPDIQQIAKDTNFDIPLGFLSESALTGADVRINASRLPLWVVLDSSDRIKYISAGISRDKLNRLKHMIDGL